MEKGTIVKDELSKGRSLVSVNYYFQGEKGAKFHIDESYDGTVVNAMLPKQGISLTMRVIKHKFTTNPSYLVKFEMKLFYTKVLVDVDEFTGIGCKYFMEKKE